MTGTAQLFESDVLVVGAPRKRRGERRSASDDFALQIRANGLPEPAREWRFAKSIGRQWRFDFAFLDHKIAVEVEGLVVRRIHGQIVVQGRHASISGFKEDCMKYANAAVLGWTVLRFEQSQIKDRTAIEYTMRMLATKGWKVPL